MDTKSDQFKTNTISETDRYLVWTAEEPDEETTYHVELGSLTIHFFNEEWEEFISLLKPLV